MTNGLHQPIFRPHEHQRHDGPSTPMKESLERVATTISRQLKAHEPTAGTRFLVLATCTGLAITQPLLALLGDTPILFVFNGIDGTALVWIALLIAVIPPVALWTIGTVGRRIHAGAGTAVHLISVWILLVMAVIQLLKYQMV